MLCNAAAVDRACPAGLNTCMSVHHMTGQSSTYSQAVQYRTVGVAKMCSSRTNCSMQAGCSIWEGRKVCTTCCARSYCNEKVPWGEEDVDFMRGKAGRGLKPEVEIICAVIILMTYAVFFCFK